MRGPQVTPQVLLSHGTAYRGGVAAVDGWRMSHLKNTKSTKCDEQISEGEELLVTSCCMLYNTSAGDSRGFGTTTEKAECCSVFSSTEK